jgi:hypothetical protein
MQIMTDLDLGSPPKNLGSGWSQHWLQGTVQILIPVSVFGTVPGTGTC